MEAWRRGDMEMWRHGHGYGQGNGHGLDKDKAMGKDMARMIFCIGTYTQSAPPPQSRTFNDGEGVKTIHEPLCLLYSISLQGTFSSGSPVSVSMSLNVSTSVSMSISMFLYKYMQVQVHVLVYVHVTVCRSTVPVHIHVYFYVFVHNHVVPVLNPEFQVLFLPTSIDTLYTRKEVQKCIFTYK
jgi:hypothetical protein